MATVQSQYLAGKTVNVPHTEHTQGVDSDGNVEKGTVTFDADGNAEVSNRLADGLLQFYPRFVTIVKRDVLPKSKAKPRTTGKAAPKS